MKQLIILGAGGYGKTVADLAAQLNGYEKIAFLDDGSASPEVLGKCEAFRDFAGEETQMIPAFGNNGLRLRWLKTLVDAEIDVPTLVHPRAYVSPRATLGRGTVVLPMAVVNTGVRVGEGCIVNIGALIDHDTVVEAGVHLAPGAIVKAENRIPAGVKIDSGRVIENREYPL